MNEQQKSLYDQVMKNVTIQALDAWKYKSTLELVSSSISYVRHILDMASGNTSSPAVSEVSLERVKGELDSIKEAIDEYSARWEKYS
ncbi:hypothetical protein, partial [Streptococcus anginosus]|uniref:hypothetical protein n=2 Tax=Bacillati TaxID=1783272 RepID=UPI0021F8A53D